MAIGQFKNIVVKTVLFIPKINTIWTKIIKRVGNIEEMFKEFTGGVGVGGIIHGEFKGDGHEIERIHSHPSCAVRLLDSPPMGRGELRSKTPILSMPRNPPSKTLRPVISFRLTHQVKFIRHL